MASVTDITFIAAFRILRSEDSQRIEEAALAGGLMTIRLAREGLSTLIADSEIVGCGHGRWGRHIGPRIRCPVRVGVHAGTLIHRAHARRGRDAFKIVLVRKCRRDSRQSDGGCKNKGGDFHGLTPLCAAR